VRAARPTEARGWANRRVFCARRRTVNHGEKSTVEDRLRGAGAVEPDTLGPPELQERRIRKIFLGSVGLGFGLTIGLAILVWHSQRIANHLLVIYFGLMLWALAVAAYAFWSVVQRLALARRSSARHAIVDELTGAYNYRYLDGRLSDEYERIRRHGGRVSLLYVDVEHLGRINEQCGLTTGDLTLRRLAALINEQIRACDVLGRVGGDEFIVLLPTTSRKQAAIAGDRLRDRVQQTAFDFAEAGCVDSVKISIGVAAYPDNGDSMPNVVTAASLALYKAKEGGGDRVEVSDRFVSQADVARGGKTREHGQRSVEEGG